MEAALVGERAATPAISDDQLIAAVLAGEGGFEELVARYERAVYHLAYRMLRDVEDAKDAAQESWVKAFRGLGRFRPGARFVTWMLTICYRICCDRLGQRRRFSTAELPDVPDTAAGPERASEDADDARLLRTAIDALPDRYRAVVVLYHLQGNAYGEIATILGLPLGTVKTHLFRAKLLLRTALESSAERRTP